VSYRIFSLRVKGWGTKLTKFSSDDRCGLCQVPDEQQQACAWDVESQPPQGYNPEKCQIGQSLGWLTWRGFFVAKWTKVLIVAVPTWKWGNEEKNGDGVDCVVAREWCMKPGPERWARLTAPGSLPSTQVERRGWSNWQCQCCHSGTHVTGPTSDNAQLPPSALQSEPALAQVLYVYNQYGPPL